MVKCWANLSNDKQKVFETFSQFVNRIVGIGNEKESVIVNNSPVSNEESITPTRKELRKDLIKSIQENEIDSVYEELKVDHIRSNKEREAVKDRFKSEQFDEKHGLIVDGYTNLEYADVNDYLRGNDITHNKWVGGNGGGKGGKLESYIVEEDSEEMRVVASKVIAMERAYESLKPIEEPVELFRGIERNPKLDLSSYDNLKEGDEFSDGAYMSSTPNEEIADQFAEGGPQGGIKLVMKMSPPTQNAKDLGSFNQFGEEETLVNKGTK